MKRVLVIGGSGFLGQHIIRELIGADFEIYALEHDRPVREATGANIIKGSIKEIDKALIRRVKPDIVLHLARPKFPRLRKSGRLLASCYAAWLNYHLIRELERSGHPCRLIFASGSLMYGNSARPFAENSPLNPISYARQYYYGEMPVVTALEKGNLPITIVRFPWLLGPGSWFQWFYMETMKKYSAVPLFGTGDNLMEIVDIRDAAKAMVLIASSRENPRIVNLTSPRPVTQLEFASAVSKVTGLPVRDHRTIIPRRIEKAALEAFTSNIVLSSIHEDLLKDFQYTSLPESISWVLNFADASKGALTI